MTTSSEITLVGPLDSPPVAHTRVKNPKLRRTLFALIKFGLGMVFTQSVLGALFVLGWTYRLAQRTVLWCWWRQRRDRVGTGTFREWIVSVDAVADQRDWPNWILAPRVSHVWRERKPRTLWRKFSMLVRLAVGSLAVNLRTGIQALFNTWVVTMPGCMLMVFSWYAGWQNSFNKGYELAAIGPAMGVAGIALFVAAMLYLPMAQMRHAATGDWRAFYQVRLVRNLIRERWMASVFLAGCYLVAALPLNILKTAIYFLPNSYPEMENWTPEQALQFLNTYFFWSAALFFPLFVLLRLVAGWIYAGGILRLLGKEMISAEDLGVEEREALQSLELENGLAMKPRGWFIRTAAWFASRAGRVTSTVMLIILWFAFVVTTVYVGEFLHFHPLSGWLNQPLIQLPYFRYVPGHLESFWNSQIGPLLLLGAVIGIFALVVRGFRSVGNVLLPDRVPLEAADRVRSIGNR